MSLILVGKIQIVKVIFFSPYSNVFITTTTTVVIIIMIIKHFFLSQLDRNSVIFLGSNFYRVFRVLSFFFSQTVPVYLDPSKTLV